MAATRHTGQRAIIVGAGIGGIAAPLPQGRGGGEVRMQGRPAGGGGGGPPPRGPPRAPPRGGVSHIPAPPGLRR